MIRLYDGTVPFVFGNLRSRCGDRHVAEDLTAYTFLAAIGQAKRGAVEEVTVAWLIGIARHKLADHWRRAARSSAAVDLDDSDLDANACAADPWDAVIDTQRVLNVLERLGPHHRSALTLRHLDGLPVPQVAALLGRTVHATEALLVRARVAFRAVYEGTGP